MSVERRYGMIKPIEGQEIILKGDQTQAIRLMLENKLFTILELPRIDDAYPRQNQIMEVKVCAIRNRSSNRPYECCDRFLCICDHPEREKNRFEKAVRFVFGLNGMAEEMPEPTMEYPAVDEFLGSMRNKELVFTGYYYDAGGDTEGIYREFFQYEYLRLRKPVLYDLFYDIRFYLTPVKENNQVGLSALDVRHLNLLDQTLQFLKEKTNDCSRRRDKDLSVIFEAQSDMAQASCFLRTYHRNSYDPVGMLCYRFSAFVLPGKVPAECAAVGKRVIDLKDGSTYFLEQVHVNTEIFPSIDDLWGWIAEDIELLSED